MSTQLADQPISTLTVAEMQALIRETVEEILQQMLEERDVGLLTYSRSEVDPLGLKEAGIALEMSVGEKEPGQLQWNCRNH